MYLDLKWFIFIVFMFVILTCGFIWYYNTVVYSEIPRKNFLIYALKGILMNRFPKNIPINHFFFQFLVEGWKQFQTEGCYIFGLLQPYLLVYSEEAMKIFSNENTTVNKPSAYDLFEDFFMDNLITSSGDLWKKRRKMLNPVFYAPNLKNKSELMNRNARILVESLSKCHTEASFNIMQFLKVCSLRNIYEFLTGLELPTNESNPEVNEFIESVDKGTEMIAYRVLKPWLHPRCFLPFFSKGRLILKTIQSGLKLSQKVIERVEESFHFSQIKNKKEKGELCRNSRRTFAQLIIEQHMKDPTYTFKDMQAEMVGFISAGFDTVSYALMWSLFLMGHHQDVQDQVYEEVESVMGHNNEVSYDDLQNLKYLECAIKESLRIYPPAPFYARRTVRDIECGKYTVPKGTNVILFSYGAHRDPVMFPDPEKFDPERFLNENSKKNVMTHSFAEGMRNCIGKNFAMMELKIVLAHVIRNFKVTSLDRREDIALCWEIMLTTAKPLLMSLTPRRPISAQT